MKSFMFKPLLFLVSLLMVVACAADTPEPAQDPFPDTPENRALVAEAYEQYLDINKNHGRFIDVNGIRMHYLEWGDDSGTPLIWSHGYSSTEFELVGVAQQLVDAGYHVYTIAYRGHGQTQVEDYSFSLSHIADDIAAMMDQLGINKAVIGGLSLGGGVTTTFYENYPERALALVLEDGGADAIQARVERAYPKMKELMANFPEMPTVFEDRFAACQFLANGYMPGWGGTLPAGAVTIFQSWVKPAGDGSFSPRHDGARLWGKGAATIDPGQSHNLPLLHQSWRRVHPIITYRNLSVPMLIIDPTGGGFDLSEDFEKLRAMHPELITLVEYPDTPHAAHPMRPEWFVRDMTKLLQRLR